MIEKQKEVEGDVLISTVLFDYNSRVLHNRVNLKTIKEMTAEDYTVGGSTALLDALGNSIHHINKVQKEMPEEERPAKTMFIITTDGMENSSHEYTYEKIKHMVEKKQQKKNWEFIFLGANMDAISAAADIGIKADRATNYNCDAKGTEVNYSALNKALAKYRRADVCETGAALQDWDAEVVMDFKTRKK